MIVPLVRIEEGKISLRQISVNIQTPIYYNPTALDATKIDWIFTDAAIAYCKDMYEGNDIDHWMLSDELSSKQEIEDNKFLLQGLLNANSRDDLLSFFNSLEPRDAEYQTIKRRITIQA